MRKLLLFVVALVVVFAVYKRMHPGAAHSATGGPAGAVQTVAPPFSLTDLNGQKVDLANYRGKVVLLDYWATWCTPCRAEIPKFIEFQNNYGGQGLQVIGLSMDDGPKPVQEFYQQFKMNYPVALGTTELAESYGGILGLPVTFLIGRDGRIAAKYVGAADMGTMEQAVKTALQTK